MQPKTINRIFLLLFTLCLFLAKGYNLYNSDNADIMPIYQHMAGFGNYSGEFYMEEAVKLSSSRYFISSGISALLKAGFSVEVTMILLYILSFALTVIGFWKLSTRFSPNNPIIFYMVALSVYTLTEITFRLGSAGFKFSMPLPSTFTAGICVFAYGVYFENKGSKGWLNKVTALSLCGFATLLQAFIGLFFGGVLLLYLFYEAFFSKNHSFSPIRTLLLGSALFVIPVAVAFLAGMTSAQSPLASSEVVEILAKFRQPHHNYPYSWARTAYLEFIIVFMATLWMLQDVKNDNKKLLIPLMSITGGVAFLSVAMNFIATSVLPLPFLSKLQSGRAFAPFILAVCLSWGMMAVCLIKRHRYWEVFSVFGILIVPLGGVLLFPFMLLTSKKPEVYLKLRIAGLLILNVITVLMIVIEPVSQPLDTVLLLMAVAMIFMGLIMHQNRIGKPVKSNFNASQIKKIIAPSMTIFLVLLFLKGPSFISPEKPYDEMEVLAEKFKAVAEEEGLLLSDPWLSESLYFRFYSERGTVVSFKCFPHADDGIREWYMRMMEVGGVNLAKKNTVGIPFRDRAWQELMHIAQKYDASYLLVNKSWFSDALAEPLVEHGQWLIYETY